MRILHVTSLLVGMLLAVPGWADDDAVTKDRKRIAGAWTIAKLVVNGNETKAENLQSLMVVNQPDGKWSLMSDKKVVAKGTSTIDPSKRPKAIDFKIVGGDQDGEEFLGIYELSEERRKMCFAPTGEDRPSKFEAPEGTGIILVVFEYQPQPLVAFPKRSQGK
ncbi:MAG: TIGR03067 domain-containing protein [Planctomycetota bacterium]